VLTKVKFTYIDTDVVKLRVKTLHSTT